MAMAKTKLPWMKFFPSDWLQDTRTLSLEARGVWIDLICAMWTSPKRGKLTWTLTGFERFIGFTNQPEVAEGILNELQFSGAAEIFFDRSHDSVTVMSRRINRDERKRKSDRDRKERNRHEEFLGRGQKSEVRSQKSEEDKEKRGLSRTKKQRTSFPDDFVVSGRILQLSQHNEWPDPVVELDAFRDYHSSRGSTFLDWEAAFRTWLRNGKRINGNRKQSKGQGSMNKINDILKRGL